MKTRALLLMFSGILNAPLAAQELLLIPETTSDHVMAFDPFDGSLIDRSFLILPDLNEMQTPISAIGVGEEIWVSDQVQDLIYRFDRTGGHLGDVTGTLDNIRGMALFDGAVYVANAGTENGAPGEAVVTFDVRGNQTGSFPTGDPFDILPFGGDLLITDINPEPDGEDIELFTADGAFVRVWHDSNGESGIDFPEQMNATAAGTIIVGGFDAPIGVYEFDRDGNQLNYWEVGIGVRGVHELGDGRIMFTDNQGVHALDRASGEVVDLLTGYQSRFIERLQDPPAPFTLEITGECPGLLTLSTTNGSPNGRVAIAYAANQGAIQIPPNQPCAGIELGLDRSARLLATVTSDSQGSSQYEGEAPPVVCGEYSVQALDLPSCAPSNVVGL